MQPEAAVVPAQPAKRPRGPRISGRTKAAIDLMIWEGLTDNQAAARVGITIHPIRLALRQAHGKAYWRQQLEVLRTRESAANIHALREVRDAKTNQMATVAAVKVLEQLTDQAGERGSAGATPGVVVQIVNQLPASHQIQHPVQMEAKPLMQLDVVPSTDEERVLSGLDR